MSIRHNATLMSALTAQGYGGHDIISLRFAGDHGLIRDVRQRHKPSAAR